VGFNRHFETSAEDEREAFSRQLNFLRKIINELPIFQGSVEFLEADDVIAYLSRYTLKNPEYLKIIVSCDRDFFQLVNDDTLVYRPNSYKVEGSKYRQSGERISRREYETDKFCIDVERKDKSGEFYLYETIFLRPENHVLIKCFGEPADNISGIKGVKEKTVLKDFPFLVSLKDNKNIYTVEDLIDHAKIQVENKIKKYEKYIIEENQEILLRNQKLIQLLDPDISNKSIKDIEGSLSNNLNFNTYKFRLSLLKEGISSNKTDHWIQAFNSLCNDPIII